VASVKRKNRRSPLQRLSDQRRSLALAGLAAGAVFSAVVLRRRRSGGEAEFGEPATPTTASAAPGANSAPTTTSGADVAATAAAATATQTDQEAPEAAAALNAEVEPIAPAEEQPTPPEAPAAADAPTPAEKSAPEEASTTLSEPTTGELSAEEASILSVLAQHGRSDDDRTVIAVATSLERQGADVANVLRKLHAEGVVSGELYTATGDKIWAVTERGVRRLGAQH
jgi:hypothetical protein